MFQNPNWFAVLAGQLPLPAAYEPLLDLRLEVGAERQLAATAGILPVHGEYLARHCRAEP